jgi:hypothetical protein
VRRLVSALASSLVVVGAALAAPAGERREAHLLTGGTAEDVSFIDGVGPSSIFMTRESLVDADKDGGQVDLYRHVRGRNLLISKPSGVPDPGKPVTGVAFDRTRVLFTTAGRYTADDDDSGRVDIYERSGGVTRLVSAPAGLQPDPDSGDATFVANGADEELPRVYFSTTEQLAADDTDGGAADIYVRSDHDTWLVTRGGDGTLPDSDPSPMTMGRSGLALRGQTAYFTTTASFDPDDVDGGRSDVYVRYYSGTTRLVSRLDAPGPDAAPFDAKFEGVDYDGSRVFFSTREPMTKSDTDGTGADGFVRRNDHTGLVTTGPSDPQTGDAEVDGVSENGKLVLFRTAAKMTPADRDSNRVDAYLRGNSQTTLATGPTGVPDPDSANVGPSHLWTDQVVVFETTERLVPGDNDGGQADLYQRYRGSTERVTAPTGVADPARPDDISLSLSSSSPGYRPPGVFFITAKRLTPDDHDSGRRDVYVRRNGRTTLVSKASGVPQRDTGDAWFEPRLANLDGFYFATSEQLAPGDTDAGAIDAYSSNLLPRLTLVRFKPSVFRANKGTTISFVLSQPASVTITFRRQGRAAVVGQRSFRGYGGTSRHAWYGRLADGRRLGPGTYTATFVARDAYGGRSMSATSDFRILKPRHK